MRRSVIRACPALRPLATRRSRNALCRRGNSPAMALAGRAKCAKRGRNRRDASRSRRDDFKPRPHPDHACRQPAAQRDAVRAAGAARGRRKLRPKAHGRRDGQGGAPVVAKQKEAGIDIGNDGEQQRVGFQTYVPQRMSGFGGESKRRRGREFEEFPELCAYLDASLSEPQPGSRTRRRRRANSTITTPRRSGDEIARFKRIAGEGRRVRRAVHDRAFAGHHLLDHAQRPLRHARGLSRGHRPRDEERVPGDPQGRPDPADRRARSRHGPHHVLPRSQSDADFIKAVRAARRHDQQRDRRHPARPRAAACLLRQLGRPAYPRHRARKDPARPLQATVGALSIEFSNPRHAHEYAALKRIRCRRT